MGDERQQGLFDGRPDGDAETQLKGTIERITFHNEENGYCVLRVKTDSREQVTITGHSNEVSEGLSLVATGKWVTDSKYGQQFQSRQLQMVQPDSAEGIEKYLSSGLIEGIGPSYAKKLMKAFGVNVFDVIENSPRDLLEIEGIGPKRLDQIITAWEEQKSVRDIMVFFHGHGIGTNQAVRIYKAYGGNAVEMIKENPYRLVRDVRGIGFRTADQIAGKMGISKNSLLRARAGLSHALLEAMGSGHCGLPKNELMELSRKLLGIDTELLEQALAIELLEGAVMAGSFGNGAQDGQQQQNSATNENQGIEDGEEGVFLASLFQSENDIALAMKHLVKGSVPWPALDVDKEIGRVESRISFELAPSQRKAVEQSLKSKVMVITGGPGVGKTTIVNSILEILSFQTCDGDDLKIKLCAPTGRAARRMSETTKMPASTIHRLLEADASTGGFRYNSERKLECDLLVVDECSMVDVRLMDALTAALPRHCALLLVGDTDQLPSVGPGQILGDVIASGVVPVICLTEIFRQARESRIILNAHKINSGEMPDLGVPEGESDFFFVSAADSATALKKITELISNRIPQKFGLDPVRDIQLLVPMNRGDLGTKSLNSALQKVLNPKALDEDAVSLTRFGWTFHEGDKVMQIVNNYDKDVYNGDTGYVLSIDDEEQTLEAEFDGNKITYAHQELESLVLAYAVTIHKSQGSEYPVVLIPLTTQHYPMLQRSLLYTAVTRGKQLVMIVGQEQAVRQAVQGKNRDACRWTRLRTLLEQG